MGYRFDPRTRRESAMQTIDRLIDKRMKSKVVTLGGTTSSSGSMYTNPADDSTLDDMTGTAPIVVSGQNIYLDTTGASTNDVLTFNGASWVPSPPAAGGSHDILSATHTDTLAAAVVRGGLIVGNSTPVWAYLAKGTAGRFLQAGATDTAWSAWGLPAAVGSSGQYLNYNGAWAQVGWSELGGVPGTFPAASHAILSTVHSDTLADTVIRGDLIVGNSTPKFSRLAFPATPTGKFLQCGATDPGWSGWALPAAVGSAGQFLRYDGTWDTPDHKVMVTSVDSTPDYLASKLTGSGLVGITTTGGSGTDQDVNIDVPAYTEGNGIDITGTAITGLVTAGAGINVTCVGAGSPQVVSALLPWTRIFKSANQDISGNNVTVTADSELTFTGAAGKTYELRGKIFYTSTAAADFKFGILTAQTYQNALSVVKDIKPDALSTLVTTSKGWTTSPNGLPTDISRTWTLGSNGGFVEFDCVIKCHASTPGAISWGFAQGTAHATDKATTLLGSYIEYRQID